MRASPPDGEDLGAVASWSDALDLADRWMPEITGSADSRIVAASARMLFAATALHVAMRIDGDGPRTLATVHRLLEDEHERPGAFLSVLAASADPDVAGVVRRVCALGAGAWGVDGNRNPAVATALLNMTEGKLRAMRRPSIARA